MPGAQCLSARRLSIWPQTQAFLMRAFRRALAGEAGGEPAASAAFGFQGKGKHVREYRPRGARRTRRTGRDGKAQTRRTVAKGSPDVPLVFDSPHSGRYYPDDFRSVISQKMLREYEDRFVDLLIADAPRHGVATIAANFPRAYIDPNRAPDDIDEEMLEAVWPDPLSPTRHSEQGTGLIFRRMHDESPIYDRPLTHGGGAAAAGWLLAALSRGAGCRAGRGAGAAIMPCGTSTGIRCGRWATR
jgi:hypothetical protein